MKNKETMCTGKKFVPQNEITVGEFNEKMKKMIPQNNSPCSGEKKRVDTQSTAVESGDSRITTSAPSGSNNQGTLAEKRMQHCDGSLDGYYPEEDIKEFIKNEDKLLDALWKREINWNEFTAMRNEEIGGELLK